MRVVDPPAEFRSTRLQIHTVPAGEQFGRIYFAKHSNPLGYAKSGSRFSDPRRRIEVNRFGVLYLGRTLTVCFIETILRDGRDGIVGDLVMEESELERRHYAEIAVVTPIRLVDLRDNGAIAMGVPSDVHHAKRHSPGRVWSAAFHEHPQAPDGILYPSRLNGHLNVAVYGRAVGKLRPIRIRRLIDVAELAPILTDLRVALATPDANVR